MKKLLTISMLLFAFAISAQSLQRIQEEENPVYTEVVDNSEFGNLWRDLISAKSSGNLERFTELLTEIKAKYPEKLTSGTRSSNIPFHACGPVNEPQVDWANYPVIIFNRGVYAGGTNSAIGENPRTVRIKSDSTGARYCAFINTTRDTMFLYKRTSYGIPGVWTQIQRYSVDAPSVFHSFDFYTADSANVTKLGFAVSIVSGIGQTDGQLYMSVVNSDGTGNRITTINTLPGRGLINPAIMTDASQYPASSTTWYITYQSFSASTPTNNPAMAAVTMDWGATFTNAVARTSFNDYDLDIDYVKYPTGDTVYVVLANNLTLTNPNLRVRRVPLANFAAGTWTQVNPANTSAPEFQSQLTVNRLTGQILCTFTATQSGVNNSCYNYTTPNGPSFNTTTIYNMPTEAAGSLLPMCDINPQDTTFRVTYITPGGLVYSYSSSLADGFTRFPAFITNSGTPSITIAPDITDFRTPNLVRYVPGVTYSPVGGGVGYNSEDMLSVGISNTSGIAKGYTLSQNYPNPFNPSTNIKYSIPVSGFVSLKVYDILGNEVANLINTNQNAGQYSIDFNTSGINLSSGVYFYKLTAGNFTDVKKMSLIK